MAATNGGIHSSSNSFLEPRFTSEHQHALMNSEEVRSRNREQLIEKLERVIQEKNASIIKLEEREQALEDALKKKNIEFRSVEEQLRQFEEKTRTFEQLHQLQVQTFEKTIRDCQIENERLCEHINDLTRQLREKDDFETIHQEKLLTFDRIAADTQLWRQKLDSYKATIEERDLTIVNLKREINELQKRKQTNVDLDDDSLRLQVSSLQASLRDRDKEIEHLKSTLRRVQQTLEPSSLTHENRWKSCSDDIGRVSPSRQSPSRKRVSSPPVRDDLDGEVQKKKFRTLTARLENAQQLLVQRDDQIATLKRVHDKRWLRLKHLQKQYRLLKDELQSYTDDESAQKSRLNEGIRKVKTGCSVCHDHRWRKQPVNKRKLLRQEDDDQVWNEIGKLRRDNARLTNENMSLNEKLDLQEVEINEQTIVINELRNELQFINEKDEKRQTQTKSKSTDENQQQRLIEQMDKKIYELETERTCLIFEHERLKTNLDLCLDEKQHLIQQRTQNNSEMKKLRLRILALQDQIHKLKRTNLPGNRKMSTNVKQRKIVKRKSCLEMLLDQNQSALIDDQSSILFRRHRACSLCDHHTETSWNKRRTRAPISKKRVGPLKKNLNSKSRLNQSFRRDSYSHFARKPVSSVPTKKGPTRIAAMRRRIEQLEMELLDAKEENEQLNQRLSATLTRINILKNSNQRLLTESEKLKTDRFVAPTTTIPDVRRHDSISSDGADSFDNLQSRLKNASFDAARQRKLNKTLQTDNETLTKNLQSLTEKLTHTERDIASKRTLIENYKSRINEIESNTTRSSEKLPNENDEERLKQLTDTMEKLRVALDSYKNRLQAVTREKQTLETRYGQLIEENQKLKTRFDDIQSKHRFNEQQLRQLRVNNDQLNLELQTARRLSEQQMSSISSRSQDTLSKMSSELERTRRRLNDYERFLHSFLNEMIRRNIQMNEQLQRAREHQRQRDSLSTTLPGYDNAMSTASKILNLTQDDLDEIMSTTDDSFQGTTKLDTTDKNERIRQKLAKLLLSHEEVANKLLKIFSKKLDDLQQIDRQVATLRNP